MPHSICPPTGLMVSDGGFGYSMATAPMLPGQAARLGRAGYHNPGHQLGFERWMQLEVSDVVELAINSQRIRRSQKATNDGCVFDQAFISPVMRVVSPRPARSLVKPPATILRYTRRRYRNPIDVTIFAAVYGCM